MRRNTTLASAAARRPGRRRMQSGASLRPAATRILPGIQGGGAGRRCGSPGLEARRAARRRDSQQLVGGLSTIRSSMNSRRGSRYRTKPSSRPRRTTAPRTRWSWKRKPQLFPTLSLAPSVTREKSSAAARRVRRCFRRLQRRVRPRHGFDHAGFDYRRVRPRRRRLLECSSTRPRNCLRSLPLEASYQIDLWGSIRNTVAENRFSAQASAAQLANALLSTQSTLAQDYFQLRVADEQRRILESTVADYQASLQLVRTLFDNGLDSDEDVASAETQLDSAIAQATDVGVARAQYEHAIAVLIGVPPAKFSIPYEHFNQPLPAIPVGVPSDLLERRPDIAAAERQVAETNAQIGVARAAFFPSLTLTGSIGYESTLLSQLFNAPNRFWSVGPSLAQILFDGGQRRAAVAQARALNESQVATYRQTVLNAFQSVEDNLASLRILSQELGAAAQGHHGGEAHGGTLGGAVSQWRRQLRERHHRAKCLSERTRDGAPGSTPSTDGQRQLINDLGGGWATTQMGQTERMASTRRRRVASRGFPPRMRGRRYPILRPCRRVKFSRKSSSSRTRSHGTVAGRPRPAMRRVCNGPSLNPSRSSTSA